MEPPNDTRSITLKYAGRCRSCDAFLPTDERAFWSPSTRKVWCVQCLHGHSASPQRESTRAAADSRPDAPGAAGTRSRDSASGGGTRRRTPWQRLCLYAERCTAAEAANSLVPHGERDSRWFLLGGEEKLVVGKGDWVSVAGKLSDKLGSRTPSIIYGWPTVVLAVNHRPMVAPLFALALEEGEERDDRRQLHAATEPEFNLAVTASGIFDPVIVEEVGELLDDGLPFGDAEALGALAGRTADLLGLEMMSAPNPWALESNVRRGQGVYNAAVVVLAERYGYTASLRQELKELRAREDWSATAAGQLLNGSVRPEPDARPLGPLAAPLPCNQSQEKTLERVRRDRLTVVTGPPGTGKTQLVVNAVTNAWLDGDTVLVTSTNNGAVDVAVDRSKTDVGTGLLVRTGNRDEREQVPSRVTLASSRAAEWQASQAELRARLKRAATERSGLLGKLARLDALDMSLLQVLEERKELQRDLKEARRNLWSDGVPHLTITPRRVKRRAERLLRTWWFPRVRAGRLREALRCRETAGMEELVNWARLEQRVGRTALQLQQERAERQRLHAALGDPSARVREADRKWAEASLRAIRDATAARIGSGGARVARLSRAAPNSHVFKRGIRDSLPSLRGWACTALAAQSNFPLEAGLFDLVIVDEASQCSLAAVLPLAYRAKRLLIVGDPHQLNPIVPLNDGLLRKIAAQTGFDDDDLRERCFHHKGGSAYAAFESAARPQAPVLLDEHYRCHPHIARWFNKAFYGGALTVLTEVSEPSAADRAIQWWDVDGQAVRPESGSWRNEAEACGTVEKVLELVESGYTTVGVVTPFTAQARRIDQLARERLGDLVDEIDFVSGTAHRLQGDERDAIVLSPVLAPQMSKSGIRWIEKERNLLNVAVSRARRALVVVGHPLMEELGSPTLASLRAYLRQLDQDLARDPAQESPSADFRTDSESERLLLDAMQMAELAPFAKLHVEGYELDFALLERGIRLNVEVDGDQHYDARGARRRQDLTRDRVLAKLGWTVLRIPAWRCHEE